MKANIIGGGIIGLFTAYYLCKEGLEVVVFEQSDGSDGCSYGNAGMIVPSHFIPLAAPGMFEKGFRWMLDSQSPFYIKPRPDWSLINWGIQFRKSATRAQVNRAMPVRRDFALLSKKLYQELDQTEDISFGLEEKGLTLYCQSEQVLEEEIHVAETARRLGLAAEVLSPSAFAGLEPEVSVNACGAVHYPGDMHANPRELMNSLKDILHSMGVVINYNSRLVNFVSKPKSKGSLIIESDGIQKEYEADYHVLAAGSWSEQLASLLKLRLPMQAGKGYSLIRENPGIQVPSILVDGRVAVSPFSNGSIRFGGTMEISGINRKLSMNRVEGIFKTLRSFYPHLSIGKPAPAEVWQGLRPCSPDGMPYIGEIKTQNGVFIASGHAMMGLSLAPATGRVIADCILKRKELVDCTLFDPHRFDRLR